MSEGEGSEGDGKGTDASVAKGVATNNEGSGNSESSSGSGSLLHSFSVDEIQKVKICIKLGEKSLSLFNLLVVILILFSFHKGTNSAEELKVLSQ